MFHTACTGDIRPLPSSPTRRSSDLQQLGAGLLAATTGVRADLAVLVHLCVLLALLGAGPACRLTRFEQGSGEGDVLPGLAGQDPAGCLADLGAVLGQADALGPLRHHPLPPAGGRAGPAGPGTTHA